MAWCDECDRYFASEYALQQHLDNAAVHRPVYYCEPCGQYFADDRALCQHEENSVKHLKKVWNYVCEPCRWACDDLEIFEDHEEKVHHWCKMHNRYFNNANNLRQHKLSNAHGQSKQCPYCGSSFPTLYAVTLHLESGTCASGMNRRKVDQRVHDLDRSGVITKKLIGYGEWEPEPDIWATARAWNGSYYECYFCDNEYSTLAKLNGHITQIHAPKRTENIYHCPACRRQFKAFSQLMGHVEQSEICGIRKDRRVRGMLTGGYA